jgi:hypothetical protein
LKIDFIKLTNLKTCLEKLQPLSIPFKTKYQLSKLAVSLEKNLEFYSNSVREIINQYAEKDSNGEILYTDETKQNVRIIDGKISECNKAFNSLNEVEYEIIDMELDEKVFDELSVDLTYAEIEVLSLFFK